MPNRILMGEIYFVLLDPTVGREMGGGYPRPVIVVSLKWVHQKTGVVMVVPGTGTAAPYRNVVQIDPTPANGLSKVTYFACHQSRAIDESRFISPAIGRASSLDLEKVQQTLWELLGWIGQ